MVVSDFIRLYGSVLFSMLSVHRFCLLWYCGCVVVVTAVWVLYFVVMSLWIVIWTCRPYSSRLWLCMHGCIREIVIVTGRCCRNFSDGLPGRDNVIPQIGGLIRIVNGAYRGLSKRVLRIDQEELETVIPQIGGLITIVNGAYRGSNARLLSVDMDKYCAKVQIEKGIYEGRILKAIDYEDICKIIQ